MILPLEDSFRRFKLFLLRGGRQQPCQTAWLCGPCRPWHRLGARLDPGPMGAPALGTPPLPQRLCVRRGKSSVPGLTRGAAPLGTPVLPAPLPQSLARRCAGAAPPPTSRCRPRRSRRSPRSPPGPGSGLSRRRHPGACPSPDSGIPGRAEGAAGPGAPHCRQLSERHRPLRRPQLRSRRIAPSSRSRPPARSPDGRRGRSPARDGAATPGTAAGDAASRAPGGGKCYKRLLPVWFV